jgi:zinc protease
MTASAVSDATFKREVLQSAEPVLVDFSAEWCGPCKAMAPALDEVAKEMEGKVKVVKLDVDQNPGAMAAYGIRGVPTLILFKSGEPAARHTGGIAVKEKLRGWINASVRGPGTGAKPHASEFKLSNGMHVVAVADNSASFVAFTVWYRVGAADAPQGASGIACFLERLTDMSIDKIAAGKSSQSDSRRSTHMPSDSPGVTAYFQHFAKDQLKAAMEMEADRMVNLRLTEDDLATVRQALIEERRSRADNPVVRLNEQMNAALYHSHPYGLPSIGWENEMSKLTREDVLGLHQRYYVPNNAILVIAGDVTPDEVKRLAEETFGNIPAGPEIGERSRPQEPPHVAVRPRLTLKHARASKGMFCRSYAVPGYMTAKPGEAEALELLLKVLADGRTSRLHRKLVVEDKSADGLMGHYSGYRSDSGAISLQALARDGDLEAVEAGVDAVLDDIRRNGITEIELEAAKKSLAADYIYDPGNEQEKRARRYGRAIAAGRTIPQVEGWPEAVSKVTTEDIKAVANAYLDPRRSVTGWLIPEPVAAVA